MAKIEPQTNWDELLPEGYEWSGEEYDILDDVAFDPDFDFELELFLHDEENDESA